MLEFLRVFVAWLNAQGIIPREVVDTDLGDDRNNKTYLMNLPEDVPNVVCVRQYNMRLAPLVAKDACVRYIQIIVRNERHEKTIQDSEKIFQFLKIRPEYIEDISPNYWVIIDCTAGPVKMDEDSQGRYLYSLSFPITTKS
jgi:hypothetical protein